MNRPASTWYVVQKQTPNRHLVRYHIKANNIPIKPDEVYLKGNFSSFSEAEKWTTMEAELRKTTQLTPQTIQTKITTAKPPKEN